MSRERTDPTDPQPRPDQPSTHPRRQADRYTGAVLTVPPLGSWSAGYYELVSCEHPAVPAPATGITDEMIEQAARSLANHIDMGMPTPDYLRQYAREAFDAALAGYTVVELPAPDEHDEFVIETDELVVHGYAGAGEPHVEICHECADDDGPRTDEIILPVWLARPMFLAGLAACHLAERRAAERDRLAAESSGDGESRG